MKKFKNYLFGCMFVASGALILGSGGVRRLYLL